MGLSPLTRNAKLFAFAKKKKCFGRILCELRLSNEWSNQIMNLMVNRVCAWNKEINQRIKILVHKAINIEEALIADIFALRTFPVIFALFTEKVFCSFLLASLFSCKYTCMIISLLEAQSDIACPYGH